GAAVVEGCGLDAEDAGGAEVGERDSVGEGVGHVEGEAVGGVGAVEDGRVVAGTFGVFDLPAEAGVGVVDRRAEGGGVGDAGEGVVGLGREGDQGVDGEGGGGA